MGNHQENAHMLEGWLFILCGTVEITVLIWWVKWNK